MIFGGEVDASERFIDLAVVADVDRDDSVMKEESFGPILPIVTVDNVEEAVDFIRAGEKPLSLYIFSENKQTQKYLIENTSSGSICCNDVLVQLSVESLPFGGVGNSGYGSYHGIYTYKTFSHEKSVLKRDFSAFGEILGMARYPPYSDKKINIMNNLVRTRRMPSLGWISKLFWIGLGAVSVIALKKYSKALQMEWIDELIN